MKYNCIGSIGYTLFNNAGFLVILIIFIPMWMRGEYVDTETAFSMLAMIFYLFLSVNSLFLYAMSTMN